MSNTRFDLKSSDRTVRERKEDADLLTGRGKYADDVSIKGQVYLAFVHSPVAHGRIRSIDTEAARQADGVLGVWTGTDMKAAGYQAAKSMMPIPNRDGSPQPRRSAIPSLWIACASPANASPASPPPHRLRHATRPRL